MVPGGLIPYPTPEPAASGSRSLIRRGSFLGLAAAVACAFFGARQLARPGRDAQGTTRPAAGDVHLPRSADSSFRIVRETVRARLYTQQSPTPSMMSAGRREDISGGDRATSTAGASRDAVRATDIRAPGRANDAASPPLSPPVPPSVALVGELSAATGVELPSVSAAVAQPTALAAKPVPASSTVDQQRLVLDVLKRYKRAYDNLDAAGAHAVWPTVNRDALAKAFAGLTTQNVSLNRCDVEVTGDTARAECTGTARWTPRVGNAQVQSRQWSFRLRSADQGWTIVNATVR